MGESRHVLLSSRRKSSDILPAVACQLINFDAQHADKAQQAFSSVRVPTLFNAIPAIESLHAAWDNRSKKSKYAPFHPALEAASEKLNDYYEKTADSDAHVFAMCKLFRYMHEH